MKIAIIGAGIAGIIVVHCLRKCGHDKFVYEKSILDGDLQLPSPEQMQRSIRNILDWERQNINYEPSRFGAVNAGFQQYNDIMLKDPGIFPYRKFPKALAAFFNQCGVSEYKDILEEGGFTQGYYETGHLKSKKSPGKRVHKGVISSALLHKDNFIVIGEKSPGPANAPPLPVRVWRTVVCLRALISNNSQAWTTNTIPQK